VALDRNERARRCRAVAGLAGQPLVASRAGGAFDTIDQFAVQHHGLAPALVFVDATGSFDNDTECVNGSRGNAADHLTKDVAPFMVSNFGASADRAHWVGYRRIVDGRYLWG